MKKSIYAARLAVFTILVLLIGVTPVYAASHTDHYACGLTCEHDQPHENMAAFAWAESALSAGDYYLEYDRTFSKDIYITDEVRLCFNGHTITFDEGYGIRVEEGGSLELCDCVGTGGIARGPRVSNFDSAILANFGTMSIYSGNYCLDGEGGTVQNAGVCTVYGGTFGIYLDNEKTMTVYQATIDTSKRSMSEGIYNAAGATLKIYDCKITAHCNSLRNNGSATIYGGSFVSTRNDTKFLGSDSIQNYSRLDIYDATISAVNGSGIHNDKDGTLYFYGGSSTSGGADRTTVAGIYNRGKLTVSGGTLGGYKGIYNGSAYSGTTSGGGTCKITGGTITGTLCGVHNSGNAWSETTAGTTVRKYSKATLQISNAPTISKIILDFPDALTFSYSGTTPIDLEIDMEDFGVGDTVWSYNYTNIPLINLLNDGYVLLRDYSDVVLASVYFGAGGNNLRWNLTPEGVLTISGMGDMEDYGFSSEQPWCYSKTQIDIIEVEIESGVTSIGSAAFSNCTSLTKIAIPEGITSIGNWAFEYCDALEEVWLPTSIKNINRNIFNACDAAPNIIHYAGCRHQWGKVSIDTQSVPFDPVCVANINNDDGNCLTELRCSVCNDVDIAAQEAHTGGTPTCTSLAECEMCGTAYGDYGHVFDQEVCATEYEHTPETCTTPAVYYKSCACGAQSAETFIGPAPIGHVFDCKMEEEPYLLYEATCDEGAYFFKSCVCGLASDVDVFQGVPLGHTFISYSDNGNGTETAPCVRTCGKTDTRYRTFAELFPDQAFRAYVTGTVLKNSAGDKSDNARITAAQLAILAAETEVDLYKMGITSLQGIEYFTGLETFNCYGNALTVLDISANNALKTLYCNSNVLTELNLSGNTALETLQCGDNALTELDVSNNTALVQLNCSSNALTELDVSNNTALLQLDCNDNALTELDLTANTALTVLACEKTRLTTLDISSNPDLQLLSCNDIGLTVLDLSKNTALQFLLCQNNALTELDLTANTALFYVHCYNNALTSLDIAANTSLITLVCSPQTAAKTAPIVIDTGRGWTLDMAAFLGENGDLSRVTMTDGGVLENGIVTYAEKPVQVTYQYETGIDGVAMDVAWMAMHGPVHMHMYDQQNTDALYLKSAATCTMPARYVQSCTCGKAGEETFLYGDTLPHVFDQQNTNESYLKTAATCTARAVYYYACDCGATDETTYEYGAKLPHVFDQTKTDEAYLKKPATCTKAAFYYKSCVCGEPGTSLFVSGEALGHNHGHVWENNALVYTCSRCNDNRTVLLSVQFDETKGTLVLSNEVPEGVQVWAVAYDAYGRMTRLVVLKYEQTTTFSDSASIRMFVLNGSFNPIAESKGIF